MASYRVNSNLYPQEKTISNLKLTTHGQIYEVRNACSPTSAHYIYHHGVVLKGFIRPAVIPEVYPNQHTKCLSSRVQKQLESGRLEN